MTTTRLIRFGALTYQAGTSATPGTKKSYPARNVSLTTLNVNMNDVRPWVGAAQPAAPVPGDWFSRLSFDMNIDGQEGSAKAPHIGRWLEASGFGVSGTTAFTYAQGDPHTDGSTPDGVTAAVAAWVNIDGYEYSCPGMLADGSIHFAAGQVPYLHIDAEGFFGVGQTSAGQGGEVAQTTYGVFVTPISSQLMSGTINGVSGLVISDFTYNFGNQISPQMDVNGVKGRSAPVIVSRVPTFNVRFKLDATATIDPTALFLAGTSIAFSFTHNDGGTVFDELLVTWTGIITGVPQIEDQDGISWWSISGIQDFSTGALTLAWSDN